jgi:hypothetical protein
VVEVVLWNPDRAIPIYVPVLGPEMRLMQLIEGLPLPVWVLAPEEIPEGVYRRLYLYFVDMLAYWVWQLTEGLVPLLRGAADRADHLAVEVELLPGPGWLEHDSDEAPDATLRCEPANSESLRMRIGPAIVRGLMTPDNAAERSVIHTLLGGLRAWGEREGYHELAGLTDVAIDVLLDQFVPLGRKKKLLFFPGEVNPQLLEPGLAEVREIQPFDTQQVLDHIGDYCANGLRLPEGPVAYERRTPVLNAVVGFLYGELERLAGTLSPDHLLERLVALNEALVHRQEHRRLTIPTQIACFGSVALRAERLRRELPLAATAAVASRFLIEYVTARPPSGIRPFSLSVYDRLLAIAGEIIGIANASNAIRYGLSDRPCAMLRSGRLAIGEGELEVAVDAYMGVYALGEIGRSADQFGRHWRASGGASPPAEVQALIRQMNEASTVEFGHSLQDFLDCLAEIVHLGIEMRSEPKVMLVSDLRRGLDLALKWGEPKIATVLEWLTLRPRPNFLTPPSGFVKADVYPWHFNRALSYVRRPLLVRSRGGVEEILWGVRHVHQATGYLLNLCLGGKLKASSQAMRRLMGELHTRDGEEFNRRVARLYERVPGLVVRTQVKKVGKQRISRRPGEDLGDIDVLVADLGHFQILAIETKDFSAALTPSELTNELAELFGSADGRQGAVQRHLERVAWLRDHLAATLEWLGLPPDNLQRWTVQPVVVLERELLSPFLARQPVQILAYREMRERLEEKSQILPRR